MAVDPSVQTFDVLCVQNRLRLLYFGVAAGPVLGNGKFDGSVTSSAPGVFVVTFNQQFARVPEAFVTTKTDDTFGRISAIALNSVTIEINDLAGAPVDGEFSLIVSGSDAVDFVNQM